MHEDPGDLAETVEVCDLCGIELPHQVIATESARVIGVHHLHFNRRFLDSDSESLNIPPTNIKFFTVTKCMRAANALAGAELGAVFRVKNPVEYTVFDLETWSLRSHTDADNTAATFRECFFEKGVSAVCVFVRYIGREYTGFDHVAADVFALKIRGNHLSCVAPVGTKGVETDEEQSSGLVVHMTMWGWVVYINGSSGYKKSNFALLHKLCSSKIKSRTGRVLGSGRKKINYLLASIWHDDQPGGIAHA